MINDFTITTTTVSVQRNGSSDISKSSHQSGKTNFILLQLRHCVERKTCQNDWREWPNELIDNYIDTINNILLSPLSSSSSAAVGYGGLEFMVRG